MKVWSLVHDGLDLFFARALALAKNWRVLFTCLKVVVVNRDMHLLQQLLSYAGEDVHAEPVSLSVSFAIRRNRTTWDCARQAGSIVDVEVLAKQTGYIVHDFEFVKDCRSVAQTSARGVSRRKQSGKEKAAGQPLFKQYTFHIGMF